MASYVVMEPPREGPENAALVRDGFAFLAFVIPFLWFLWHRMWIEAALAFAAALLLGALGTLEGWQTASSVMSLCLSVLIGLEARNLRVAMLRRRGWRERGVVEADNMADAELRFLSDFSAGNAAPIDEMPIAHDRRAMSGASSVRGDTGPALGLFTYPGAR